MDWETAPQIIRIKSKIKKKGKIIAIISGAINATIKIEKKQIRYLCDEQYLIDTQRENMKYESEFE